MFGDGDRIKPDAAISVSIRVCLSTPPGCSINDETWAEPTCDGDKGILRRLTDGRLTYGFKCDVGDTFVDAGDTFVGVLK